MALCPWSWWNDLNKSEFEWSSKIQWLKKRRANWSPVKQLRRVRRDFAVLNSLGFWTAHRRNNAAWTVLFHRFGCHNLSWIWTTPKTLLLKNVEHSRDTEGEIMDILAFEWSFFEDSMVFIKSTKTTPCTFAACATACIICIHLGFLEDWNCSSDFKLQHGQASKAQSSEDLMGSDHSRRRTWWSPWSPW